MHLKLMELRVLIPVCEFMMGALPDDEDGHDREKPCHKVEITKDFYAGKYPVTQALWELVMGNNPSKFKGANRPVENVSWFDCVEFCNKLSKLEGKEPVYTINGENVTCNWKAKGYRLLTEAEWEYCARANQNTLYSGSNNLDEVAWYSKNSGKETHLVGLKKANGFGLYDMSGNVWEWVWDWLDKKGYQSRPVTGGKPTSNPRGPTSGSRRVFRGGSWNDDAWLLPVSRRGWLEAAHRDALGFRLGLSR